MSEMEARAMPRFPRTEPPQRPFISLTEAISWIAFGCSMDAERIGQALGIDEWKSEARSRQFIIVDESLEVALEHLLDHAIDGRIELRGRQFDSLLQPECEVLTERIPEVRLTDYRRFAFWDNTLFRGTGLAWSADERDLPATSDDQFRSITVSRTDLLDAFPLGRAAQGPRSNGRRGRKPGQGSYYWKDRELFPRIQDLIRNGKAGSPHAAALMLVDETAGSGTPENRAARLARNYRQSVFYDPR